MLLTRTFKRYSVHHVVNQRMRSWDRTLTAYFFCLFCVCSQASSYTSDQCFLRHSMDRNSSTVHYKNLKLYTSVPSLCIPEPSYIDGKYQAQMYNMRNYRNILVCFTNVQLYVMCCNQQWASYSTKQHLKVIVASMLTGDTRRLVV